MGYGFEACDEKVSSLTAHSGARALRCATRQCASSKRFTHYQFDCATAAAAAQTADTFDVFATVIDATAPPQALKQPITDLTRDVLLLKRNILHVRRFLVLAMPMF